MRLRPTIRPPTPATTGAAWGGRGRRGHVAGRLAGDRRGLLAIATAVVAAVAPIAATSPSMTSARDSIAITCVARAMVQRRATLGTGRGLHCGYCTAQRTHAMRRGKRWASLCGSHVSCPRTGNEVVLLRPKRWVCLLESAPPVTGGATVDACELIAGVAGASWGAGAAGAKGAAGCGGSSCVGGAEGSAADAAVLSSKVMREARSLSRVHSVS